MVYFGIVNEQSLKNPQIINEFSIVARKQIDSWNFLLVVAYEDELDSK